MTTSANENHKKVERFRAHNPRLTASQIAIEQEAMWLRAQVGISDYDYLSLELAATCLPNCEVYGLKHVPEITLKQLSYARTDGYKKFGALARRDGDTLQIVFNDAHPPYTVRVNVMEEIYHLRLGHKPDILSLIPRNGRHRTHDIAKENEAYGCGIAALVPFAGLQAMLVNRMHIRRIAEHFAVPVEVVDERIAATNLGELMNAQIRQLALMPHKSATDHRIAGISP